MTTKLMTAEDLFALSNDDRRYELVRGVLVEMAPAGGWQGEYSFRVSLNLGIFVEPRGLGQVYVSETGFILARDPDIVRAPDVAFVSAGRLPPVRDREGYLPLAPDLAVEVVSQWDRARDAMDKVLEYLEAGVRLVWVVEPRRRTVTVWTPDRTARVLTETDELDGGKVLPGFRLAVAEVFR